MQNLLHNAWKYAAPEGKVTITVERADGFIKMR
jgi:signal transduction histidine kinase